MQQQLLCGAAISVLIAVVSGFCDRRARHRREMDRVGWVPWSLIQMLAMLGALIFASIAMHTP